MNERENLMYKIIGNISGTDAPIVFKGALITKLILQENDFKQIERATKDIDANWIGTPPKMNDLVLTINNSLNEMKELFIAVPNRDYGDMRAAGISILEKKTGDEVLSMDIDIKNVAESRYYYYGEVAIKGVLANEIMVDKIASCSSDAVYKWRTKDIIDVYSLSHCIQVNSKEIYDFSEKTNRKIQSFDSFYEKEIELKHSYNKLKGIVGKPDFESVYVYLKEFFKPFYNNDIKEKIWNSEHGLWETSQLNKEIVSFSNKKRNEINNMKFKSNQNKEPNQNKNKDLLI